VDTRGPFLLATFTRQFSWSAEKTLEGTIAGFLSMLAGLLVVQWGFEGGGLEVKPLTLKSVISLNSEHLLVLVVSCIMFLNIEGLNVET
jgi:hypothetical protein